MKKVAILGRAVGWKDAPFQDPTWEIWGLNRAYSAIKQAGGRWTRWFEIHDRSLQNAAHRQALAGLGCPVYLLQNIRISRTWNGGFLTTRLRSLFITKYPDIPNGVLYPLDEIKREFFSLVNREQFFRNTISYMIALAIYEQFDEIRLYGVNQNLEKEYERETPCVSFWLGIAIGRGIRVEVQKHSRLLNPETIYR